MPYIAKPYTEMPIIYSTFTETISPQDFRDWFEEVIAYLQSISLKHAYVVVDVLQAKTRFDTILNNQRQAIMHPFFSEEGARGIFLTFVFVGTDPLVKLAIDLLKQPQFGGFESPLFKSRDEAMNFIIQDHAQRLPHAP